MSSDFLPQTILRSQTFFRRRIQHLGLRDACPQVFFERKRFGNGSPGGKGWWKRQTRHNFIDTAGLEAATRVPDEIMGETVFYGGHLI
jgi:hypothetical protein